MSPSIAPFKDDSAGVLQRQLPELPTPCMADQPSSNLSPPQQHGAPPPPPPTLEHPGLATNVQLEAADFLAAQGIVPPTSIALQAHPALSAINTQPIPVLPATQPYGNPGMSFFQPALYQDSSMHFSGTSGLRSLESSGGATSTTAPEPRASQVATNIHSVGHGGVHSSSDVISDQPSLSIPPSTLQNTTESASTDARASPTSAGGWSTAGSQTCRKSADVAGSTSSTSTAGVSTVSEQLSAAHEALAAQQHLIAQLQGFSFTPASIAAPPPPAPMQHPSALAVSQAHLMAAAGHPATTALMGTQAGTSTQFVPVAPKTLSTAAPPTATSGAAAAYANAAAAARQVAAQKGAMVQAAAASYQAAAAQLSAMPAGSMQAANVAAFAHQAAQNYHAAANEAQSATQTANHLEQAANTVAAMTPVTAPLAAQIASCGALLPKAMQQALPLAALQMTTTTPALTAAWQPAGEHMASAAVPGIDPVATTLGQPSLPPLTAAGGLAAGTFPGVQAHAPATVALAATTLPALAAGTAVNAVQQPGTTFPVQSVIPIPAPSTVDLSGASVPLAGMVGHSAPSATSSVLTTPTASTVVSTGGVSSSSRASGIGALGVAGHTTEQHEAAQVAMSALAHLDAMHGGRLSASTSRETASTAAGASTHPGTPRVIKAVCSSGGAFVRSASGNWEYEGGETRLVSVPSGCSAEVLFATLERSTSFLSESSDFTLTEFNPTIKYRLPSDPTVLVDLVDDDDVANMFEEHNEAIMTGATSTSSGSSRSQPKLHIYVQWHHVGSQVLNTGSRDSFGGSSGLPRGRSTGSLGRGRSASRCNGGSSSNYHDAAPASWSTRNSREGGSECPPQSNQYAGHERSHGSGGGNVVDLSEGKSCASRAAAFAEQNTGSRRQMASAAEQRGHGGENGVIHGNKSEDDSDGEPQPTSRSGHLERAVKTQSKTIQRYRLRYKESSVDISGIVERMEVIDPEDITLVRFLGSGGYGDVYLARWHACDVAVKCLNPSLFYQTGGEPGNINRAAVVELIREADMLGSLRHPCIVWTYGVVLGKKLSSCNAGKSRDLLDAIQEEAGAAPSMMPGVLRPPALVTEYMAGGSLRSALARRSDIVAGPLTRVILALDAAKGMEYLHAKSIVHFDLKSGNLLLGYRDKRPVCKVADFGLARERAQTFVSGVNSQRGTLPWTAPEILRTPESVTEKVDIFSFAVVMWELWTGKEPYDGLNYHALLVKLADPKTRLRPPVPGTQEWAAMGEEFGEAPPELAPGWRSLMEKCWGEEPTARPTFSDVIAELRKMVAAVRPSRGSRPSRASSG